MAPVDEHVMAWAAAWTSSPGLSLSWLILLLCSIVLLSLCTSCYSHSTETGAQPCSSSLTQKVSAQWGGEPLEENASTDSISDENGISAEKHRCTWEAATKHGYPVRSMTVAPNQQAKTPTHTRGLSNGYFSQGLPMPKHDMTFSKTFLRNLEIPHYQTRDRIASSFYPALPKQTGHHMHGFEGTDNIIYRSTELETDSIHSLSVSHIYAELDLEDEREHSYACIGGANASDSQHLDSCQETDEASATGQEEEEDHPYECIREPNGSDSQRPHFCTQAEEAKPKERPYQTVNELFQAAGTIEPATSQSGPSVHVPSALSDTKEPGLTGTEVTVVYASINRKKKSRYRTAALPSASDSCVPEKSEEDENAGSEPLPLIPEKHFIV